MRLRSKRTSLMANVALWMLAVLGLVACLWATIQVTEGTAATSTPQFGWLVLAVTLPTVLAFFGWQAFAHGWRSKLRAARASRPDALVMLMLSTSAFALDLIYAELGSDDLRDSHLRTLPKIGGYPVVIVDRAGIAIWNSGRSRTTWSVPWERVSEVRLAQSWYGRAIITPTVDLDVAVGQANATVAFAPAHEDWRIGFPMLSRERVAQVVDAVRAQR